MSDDGIMDRLRVAMAAFDCGTGGRAERLTSARRVISLVRELLAEVDGVRRAGGVQFHVDVEPLGGPVPGVAGSHLPDRDDDYTPEALNRTAD